MPDKSWKGKGEALPRRSPRKRGKTCGRPFKAPRLVEETVQEIVTITETETQTSDSQVQVITETENDRDIQARAVAQPVRTPYVKGLRLMSEREADKEARYGEVLHWSTNSDKEVVTERGQDRTFGSDATGSTPDICKSPDMSSGIVPGEIVQASDFEIQARQHKTKFNYEDPSLVEETQAQDSDGDSEDNVPIATVLTRPKKTIQLTVQPITESKVELLFHCMNCVHTKEKPVRQLSGSIQLRMQCHSNRSI
jgi:hypothetical protein